MEWRDRYPQSDIPRIFCYGTYGANIFKTMVDVIKSEVFLYRTNQRNPSVDW